VGKISVVIPTYNRARLLPRAIESAQQAGADLEVIVVDDCSTDDTREICAGIADIRYVRLKSNGGLANARNVGISESSCEFVAFVDDDDLRLPGSLDKQFQALIADDQIAFCYGQALIGDARRQLPTGEIYPLRCPQGDIFWDLLEDNFIPMPSVLARKSSLVDEGGFNTALKLIEDWDMWLRLSERFSSRQWKSRSRSIARPSPDPSKCAQTPRKYVNRRRACNRWRSIARARVHRRAQNAVACNGNSATARMRY